MKPVHPAVLPFVKTEPRTIPVALIHPSPLNPRMVAEEERGALAPSLRAQGQLQALWVRPHKERPGEFELVDGERRWHGLRAAGIAEARVDVGDYSDDHILRITWTTGTEGKGLTAIEQARWAQRALQLPGATLESVGALVGVSPATLHKSLALLDLDGETQAAVQAGILPPITAYIIASVPGQHARAAFAKEVISPEDEPGPLTSRQAEELRRAKYCRSLQGASFDTAAADLVAAAGACATCRFRAGNNREEYGEVKNPHTCMHVACFEEKVAAARVRAAAREAGKVPLTAAENAMVFSAGSVEPSPDCGYVAATRPIPADLVKPEVAAKGAPTFAEVSPAARVFVATDGQGRLVDLVRVSEAIAATSEPAIFRAEVAASYGLRDNEGGRHVDSAGQVVTTPAMREVAPAASDPTPTSIAGEEKREQKAKARAERSKARHLRACADWMLELNNALTASSDHKPSGYAYTLASLRWEHLILTVPDEDALLVLRALSAEEPAKGQGGKEALKEWVAAIGGVEELSAVVDLLMIASALRAQGVEAKWVVEWHRHLVQPVEALRSGRPATVAPEPMADGEREQLTAMVRAREGGMSAHKIAREFDRPLADVCGALELDLAAEMTRHDELDKAPRSDNAGPRTPK